MIPPPELGCLKLGIDLLNFLKIWHKIHSCNQLSIYLEHETNWSNSDQVHKVYDIYFPWIVEDIIHWCFVSEDILWNARNILEVIEKIKHGYSKAY